jgi:hypothetical protein
MHQNGVKEMADLHLTKEYLDRFAIGDIFIETGTHLGETVQVAIDYGKFKEIHSIEIDEGLYNKAVERFKDNPNVHLHLGDSVDILPILFDSLDHPFTLWLDAHASGELKGGGYGPCPLLFELNSLREKKFYTTQEGIKSEIIKQKHTIFIDDRRLLGSAEWGHVTWDQIVNGLKQINPEYCVTFLDGHQAQDVICCYVEK